MTREIGSGGRHEEAFALPSADPTGLPCPLEALGELSREVLRTGKCLRFRARGASMSPLCRKPKIESGCHRPAHRQKMPSRQIMLVANAWQWASPSSR